MLSSRRLDIQQGATIFHPSKSTPPPPKPPSPTTALNSSCPPSARRLRSDLHKAPGLNSCRFLINFQDQQPEIRVGRRRESLSLFCTRVQNRFPIRSFLADGAVAPEAWADTEVSPPFGTTGATLRTNGASAPIEQTGGMTSVSSHLRGRAALIIVPASSAKPIPDSQIPRRRRSCA